MSISSPSSLGNNDNSAEKRARDLDKLRRELGDDILELLDRDDVTEISLNPDGSLLFDSIGHGMQPIGTMGASQALNLLGTVASIRGRVLNAGDPILECEFPLGGRLAAAVSPITAAPTFSLRRPMVKRITLADYESQGIMTGAQAEVIRNAIKARLNIVISGGTSSGKTTFLIAALDEVGTLAPDHRIVTIEDTREIQCSSKNWVALCSDRTIPITLERLLHLSLRMRPDRIILGEARGGEVLQMLKAWNTGHPGGLATLHANSPEDVLTRIEMMMLEVVQTPIPAVIGSAVDLIVQMERTPEGRRVTQILRVHGYSDGRYQTEVISHIN